MWSLPNSKVSWGAYPAMRDVESLHQQGELGSLYINENRDQVYSQDKTYIYGNRDQIYSQDYVYTYQNRDQIYLQQWGEMIQTCLE